MAHLGPQEHPHDGTGYHSCAGLAEKRMFNSGDTCPHCGVILIYTEPTHPYELWEEATEAHREKMMKAVKAGKNPGKV